MYPCWHCGALNLYGIILQIFQGEEYYSGNNYPKALSAYQNNGEGGREGEREREQSYRYVAQKTDLDTQRFYILVRLRRIPSVARVLRSLRASKSRRNRLNSV